MEAGCLPPGHQTLQPPGRCTLGRLKKTRILAPDSWAARLLCLPIRRKVLSSLTWDIWFSLIINNLLMFRLPGLCCKSSYIFPGSPFSSLEAVSQSCLRCYILGWNPPFLHWIKHNSPLKKIFIYLFTFKFIVGHAWSPLLLGLFSVCGKRELPFSCFSSQRLLSSCSMGSRVQSHPQLQSQALERSSTCEAWA